MRKTNFLHNLIYFFQDISPGFVKTEILGATPADQSEKFAAVPALEPEDISESIIYVLGTPQRVQITELEIRPLGESY